MLKFSIVFSLFLTFFSSAVLAEKPVSAIKRLEQIALEAADEIAANMTVFHEIENIKFKREVMGRAGLQLYVVFFNNMGQPVDYFVTDGKCTSSGKRLVKNWQFKEGQTGVDSDGYSVYGDFVVPKSSVDGTFGHSGKYIYCKTADGKYKQWNGTYYASDVPIEVTIKPLVVKKQ